MVFVDFLNARDSESAQKECQSVKEASHVEEETGHGHGRDFKL